MTSRPWTGLRAQAQPQAGEENTTGQPGRAVTGLRQAKAGPLHAPTRTLAVEECTTGQPLTGPLRAQAQPQAGEENTTGQPRGALTGLVRARPLAGEPA